MPSRDIIVIGGSAGGVEAVQRVAAQVAPNIPAAIFVVVHVPARTRSFLPAILSKAGPLPAMHPEDGAAIEYGRIYVAPPDHHLVIQRDHVHLSMGPKEQHHRPSINVTFRSAAIAYAERVAGVVLTGELDDGTAGLWEIKRRGGVAVVQHPEEAAFPSMPLSALKEIEVDYTVRLDSMGELLTRLASNSDTGKRTSVLGTNMEPKLTDVTCPDCRGTIWEHVHGNGVEYQCRVGHKFSPKSMLSEHFAAQEKALSAAMVALQEGATLARKLSEQFEPSIRERLHHEAREAEENAANLRRILEGRVSFSLD